MYCCTLFFYLYTIGLTNDTGNKRYICIYNLNINSIHQLLLRKDPIFFLI